jgi:SulP family sulfate permease
MLLAGLLRLGSLIRFVPNSVMVGFINAVAVLIILGQLDDFTGYESAGANKFVKALNLFLNLDQIHVQTLLVGMLTIVLILVLEKTNLKALGMVVAMVVTSLLVPALRWEEVLQVKDIADLPNALPRPVLPSLALIPNLLIPALSLAFVGLMQGASISGSIPNPDGKFPDVSRDFAGQGVANIVAGILQSTPVGGSMSATSIVVNAGARSRLANIAAGLVIAVIILVFGGFVGAIAMPALAGLLIVVGVRTLKLDRVESVLRTGLVQQVVMTITFALALLIPLQYAVLLGVALAVILFVFQQSNKIRVVQWTWVPGALPVEADAPEVIPPHAVTVLVPYGSLFYAAAPVFEEQLPKTTADTRHAVVIIALRNRTEFGSTFIDVLSRYSADLREHESKLMLAGASPQVKEQIIRTKLMQTLGRENLILATDQVGESVLEAVHEAEQWIASTTGQEATDQVSMDATKGTG